MLQAIKTLKVFGKSAKKEEKKRTRNIFHDKLANNGSSLKEIRISFCQQGSQNK